MNNAQVIAQFRDLVAEFKENEKRFALAIVKGDFKDPVVKTLFIDTYKLVTEIKEKSTQYDVLQIPDLTLRLELIAIRENKDFSYFEVLKILSKYDDTGEELNFAPEINRDEWWNMLQEEILSQVNPSRHANSEKDRSWSTFGREDSARTPERSFGTNKRMLYMGIRRCSLNLL